MKRTIFDEDHDAFRDSCRIFVDRNLRPHQEKHAAEHGFGRQMWLELGKQGLLPAPPLSAGRSRARRRVPDGGGGCIHEDATAARREGPVVVLVENRALHRGPLTVPGE